MTDPAKSITADLEATIARQQEERSRILKHVSCILGWINYVSMAGRYTEMTAEESDSFTWLMAATAER